MKRYVLGFAFSVDFREVLLLRKAKPEWQAGKLNGVGGHIEESDSSPIDAMAREFAEETGIFTWEANWTPVCLLHNERFEMHIYVTQISAANLVEAVVREANALEPVALVTTLNVADLAEQGRTIPNLAWLVPMARAALSFDAGSFYRAWYEYTPPAVPAPIRAARESLDVLP